MTRNLLQAPAGFPVLGARRAFPCLVAVVLSLAGCPAGSPPPRQNGGFAVGDSAAQPALPNPGGNGRCLVDGFPSPEAVGGAVIDALNEGQRAQLHQCLVTRQEYLSCLWKRFPASANMPGDFAYANLGKKSHKGVNRGVARWGNRGLVFAGIRFIMPPENYHDFVLHRGTVLSAATPDGMAVELMMLGSVVEMHGMFKLLSYDDG